MGQEISILQLILNASIIVQLVIALLLLFSVVSWGIILSKWVTMASVKLETRSFIHKFHNASSISSLYNSIASKDNKRSVTALFYQGINEYNKLNKQGITDKTTMVENIERALASTIDSEIDAYENKLSTLATFGSVSPYIGLLGTVWGIMHAFIGLGSAGQATLSSVAPGIAEALVATAVGLFVAIPAYIFYNKFSSDAQSLNNKMNKFADEFLNLISRRIASSVQNQDAM